jgi:ureidoacrylate peracid hydrolase
MPHKIELSPDVLKRTEQVRGKIHIFDNIDPARTAHLIVDLQNGFMEPGAAVEVPVARDIVPNVNAISKAVRDAGGLNVFLRFLIDAPTLAAWPIFYKDFSSPNHHQRMKEAFQHGCHGLELWPGLDCKPGDLVVDKTRFGAFVPGSSDLHNILQARGIDTLIVTGTCTNVCCESTARDAMQMNYKVIFVADGNATFSDAEQNATLNIMLALFADVMTTEQVLGVLARASTGRQAAE